MGALIAIAFVGLFILIAMGRLAVVNRRWRKPQIPRNGVGGFWPVNPADPNVNNPPSANGQEHHGHHHHHHDGGHHGHHGHHGGFDGGGHHHGGGGGFDAGGMSGGHSGHSH